MTDFQINSLKEVSVWKKKTMISFSPNKSILKIRFYLSVLKNELESWCITNRAKKSHYCSSGVFLFSFRRPHCTTGPIYLLTIKGKFTKNRSNLKNPSKFVFWSNEYLSNAVRKIGLRVLVWRNMQKSQIIGQFCGFHVQTKGTRPQKVYEPNIFPEARYVESMKQNRGCCWLVLYDFTWNGSPLQFFNYTTDFTRLIHLMHQSIILKRSLFDFYHGNCIVECCCRHHWLLSQFTQLFPK